MEIVPSNTQAVYRPPRTNETYADPVQSKWTHCSFATGGWQYIHTIWLKGGRYEIA
jgi:hypothetical protein